ncbi:MAG: META domain-containing protein [Sphingomicrobium sp.]
MTLRPLVALAAVVASAGCAGHPHPQATGPITHITGTSWRVVAVNGRPVTDAGDYSMRFDRDSVRARFGCNSMGGQYRLNGDVLLVSNLTTTLMGCPEPAATLESDGSAVLGQPMRIARSGADRMTLNNTAGSIALDPLP